MLSALLAGSAFAQQIENDDMYFNSTDRQKLRELKAKQYAVASARNTERTAEESEELNPTDSYSARTVNPEFSSRSNAETATADNEDYYINNYRYQTANNLRTFNNNFNDWYGRGIKACMQKIRTQEVFHRLTGRSALTFPA